MIGSSAHSAPLSDVVDKAVATIPAVSTAQARRQSAEERVRVERGALFPTVNIRGESGYQYYNAPTTRAGTTGDHTELWRSEGRIVATQLLYDGGKTFSLMDEAQNNLAAATYRINDAKQQVALQAAAAYIDVLRNQAFVDIAKENVAAHEKLLADVRRLVRSGRASDSDISQAQARLALAQANLENRQGELQTTAARYTRAVGEPPEDLISPPPPPDPATINLADMSEAAVKQNPQMMVARSVIDARRSAYEATDGLFVPTVELELSGSKGNNIDGLRGHTDDYRAMLVLTWNLYRGGSDSARAREARANLTAVKYDEADTMRFVREHVRAAYESYLKDFSRQKPLQQRVDENRKLITAYKQQFELGRRTLLDLLDVQNELFVSRAELADAQHSTMFDFYDLHAAAGDLLEQFSIEPEKPKKVMMFE